MARVYFSRMHSLRRAGVLALLSACAPGGVRSPLPEAPPTSTTPARVQGLLSILAADSMEGRATATPGYARAARFVAEEMARIGLTPAGDSEFFQRVPLWRTPQGRLTFVADFAAWDTVPADQRVLDVNVVGQVLGGDPALRDEVVLVGAHLDHVGMRANASGDSIYNGADDDASGVVTVLEAARLLLSGPQPRRTVVFIAFTGEERGGLGSSWYLRHPVHPIASTIAQLQVEMVARPDSLAGGSGKAWLTGYERSTMGELLSSAGLPVVADPRPTQQFFRRSDNYRFALAGVPAHTLSSFNLHTDYHQPGDEASRADSVHMAAVVQAAARAVRLLADGPKPEWKPGGKPEPASPRPRVP
jgi:hypothetical protein